MNPNSFYAIIPESIACRAENDYPMPEMPIAPGLGVITCRWTLGPEDYADLQARIERLAADSGVERIILNFNSPGGSVLGISPLISSIRSAKKEIIAIANHVCASAAYWIASACDKVYLASKTAVVGSIGVIATHMDLQEESKRWGVKITEIVAGTQKNLTSPFRKIDETAQKYYQNRVDEIYALFVDDVAAGRQIDSARIVALEGTDLIGQTAIDAGLADGFINFLEYVSMGKISEQIAAKTKAECDKTKESAEGEDPEKKDEEMAEDEGENPEKKDEEMAEDEGENPEKKDEGQARAERARILAILEVAGVQLSQDAIKAIKSGSSAEKFALVAIKSMRSGGNSMLSSLRNDAPAVVPSMRELSTDDEKAILASAAAEVNQHRK